LFEYETYILFKEKPPIRITFHSKLGP